MSFECNTKLFIVNVPSDRAAKALNALFEQHAVASEWDGELLNVAAGDDFIDGFVRDFSISDFGVFAKAAKRHGLRMAALVDMTVGACEGPIGGAVRWVDGCARLEGNYTSEVNSFRPVFTAKDALVIARSGAASVPEIMKAIGSEIPTFMVNKVG